MDRIEEVDVKHNLLQMSTYLDVHLLPLGGCEWRREEMVILDGTRLHEIMMV